MPRASQVFRVISLASCLCSGLALADGIPSTNGTLRYSGTAFINNAPAANTSVTVRLLTAMGGLTSCNGTTSTGPDGRFEIPLVGTACVDAIAADSNIQVRVQLAGATLSTSVKAVPYAVEAQSARLAASAEAGGALRQELDMLANGLTQRSGVTTYAAGPSQTTAMQASSSVVCFLLATTGSISCRIFDSGGTWTLQNLSGAGTCSAGCIGWAP